MSYAKDPMRVIALRRELISKPNSVNRETKRKTLHSFNKRANNTPELRLGIKLPMTIRAFLEKLIITNNLTSTYSGMILLKANLLGY
ncbi:hypothetical protein H4J55_16000 [Colwellia sp. MB3u-22]|nr:hypothetical protein [Colwellia sp. MB02u-7]MBA6237842.1 hypothetical protein [Colwellia sp. MB02u-11]MBA6300907.1 hypothetical protein [Colwellia sp. MB3u-22]MBA6312456.1 hypothetical protein [Colwellia sp. MB3u-64]